MNYVDSHCHLNSPELRGGIPAVLERARAAGVVRMAVIGSTLADSAEALEICRRYKPYGLFPVVGIHPHEVKDLPAGELPRELLDMAALSEVKAWGEIGLDYYYDNSPREVQKKRFAEQLALAHELDVPVIIHERDAHEDCMNILRAAAPVCGVFHCYSGSLEMAKELVKRGFYLSFTGAVTFKSARRALETIAWMPMERIMIETDSPYLTPVPFRGRRNDSSYVRLVAEKIAEVRGMRVEDVAAATMENGKRFFGIA